MQLRMLRSLLLLLSICMMAAQPLKASSSHMQAKELSVVGINPANAQGTLREKVALFKRIFRFLPQKEKNRDLAAVLAVTLGYFGIHRFYLGYLKQGIIQLLMGLTTIVCIVIFVTATAVTPWGAFALGYGLGFILGIWLLMDFVHILTGKLKPRKGGYKV